jgi:hypothetical protein
MHAHQLPPAMSLRSTLKRARSPVVTRIRSSALDMATKFRSWPPRGAQMQCCPSPVIDPIGLRAQSGSVSCRHKPLATAPQT